jgi:curlin associated repeat protein
MGSSNYAGIGQFGNFNYAKIVQDSVGRVAIYDQIGNNNDVTVTQTGVNPPPVVVTQHR